MWEIKYEPVISSGILNGLYQGITLPTPRGTRWEGRKREGIRSIEGGFILKTILEWELDFSLAESSFPRVSKVTSRTTEQGFESSRNLGRCETQGETPIGMRTHLGCYCLREAAYLGRVGV